MPRRYAILDVFTDKPLAGNALAVVLDAAGLDDAAMQAIAAEFNLSETVFVFPPYNPLHAARVRIFTPGAELPFAGHPTVGTAVLLGRDKAGLATAGRPEMVLVLEEKVGPVRCGVSVTGARSGHAVFDVPRKPEPLTFRADRDAIAAALGVAPAEVGFENHQPSAYTAGVPFAFVPVRDLDAIGRAHVRPAAWDAAFPPTASAAYLYCRETRGPAHQFHARMFAPGVGIVEDPATGSAAAAFSAVIARFDQPPAGSHRYLIEQGYEMGRPSLIDLEVDMDSGEVAAARIGGDAVLLAEGTLDL
ncbi:MAG: PhzF family phenazine biosynthesis protein [Bauldia sp.]